MNKNLLEIKVRISSKGGHVLDRAYQMTIWKLFSFWDIGAVKLSKSGVILLFHIQENLKYEADF